MAQNNPLEGDAPLADIVRRLKEHAVMRDSLPAMVDVLVMIGRGHDTYSAAARSAYAEYVRKMREAGL